MSGIYRKRKNVIVKKYYYELTENESTCIVILGTAAFSNMKSSAFNLTPKITTF